MDPNSNTIGIFTEKVELLECPHCGAELNVEGFTIFEPLQCPSCEATLKVPARLGNFLLVDELGRGAMGCVYLAIDESLGRHVALKVMRKEFGEDPEMLDTLRREAQAMAVLNHRNVVQVYSFGEVESQPYVVMELLDGDRLDELIAGGKTIDEIRAMEIMADVAEGLKAAHDAGLTHGDIKPANILMDTSGVAKVVDFGLARFMDPDAEIEVWGTPYYIAPEKAKKEGEDEQSDQYSLAATMFHALAGQPPFDGENPTKVVVAAIKEETPLLSDFRDDLTPQTVQVIRRMMEKTPVRRYPTYASLQADLQAALEASREAAREREAALQQPVVVQKSNLPKALAATALVLIAVVVAVVMLQKGGVAEDPWPGRELHAPFKPAETRWLREATVALEKQQLGEMQSTMLALKKDLPEGHSSQAWYQYFAGVVFVYLKMNDKALEQFNAIVDMDDLQFDDGKVPAEDPRLLASYIVGEAEMEDVEKRLRRALPYYRGLAEVAFGAKLVLDGQPIQSSRHFHTYGELPVQAPEWAYALQPIMKDFHLKTSR